VRTTSSADVVVVVRSSIGGRRRSEFAGGDEGDEGDTGDESRIALSSCRPVVRSSFDTSRDRARVDVT